MAEVPAMIAPSTRLGVAKALPDTIVGQRLAALSAD